MRTFRFGRTVEDRPGFLLGVVIMADIRILPDDKGPINDKTDCLMSENKLVGATAGAYRIERVPLSLECGRSNKGIEAVLHSFVVHAAA
jgi:hypothetical protein